MFRNLFQQAPARVAALDSRELKRRLDAGERPLLLDVRSPEEFAHDGHIAGARLLPLPVLAMRLDELPKETPIVCVCRSGNRSQVACELLARQGFQVTNLSDGMLGWHRAGLPTQLG